MPVVATNENKRFNPSTESMSKFKVLRSILEKIKHDYPWLCGFSFFGSRVKGTDQSDSDLDLCIFYDSSKTDPEKISKTVRYAIGKIISEILGLSLDYRIFLAPSSGGLWIDISENKTISDLNTFIQTIKDYIGLYGIDNIHTNRFLTTIGIPPTQNLYARFFLGVGNELYRNRQLILDFLERQENGELYFQILMSCLRHFENTSQRDGVAVRTIDRLPKSIADARRYFMLRKTREIFHLHN